MAFAYLIDVIFGAKFLMLPGSNRGVERFAVVTVVFCAVELIAAAFLLGPRRRLAPFGMVAVFLLAVMFVAMFFGTFQASARAGASALSPTPSSAAHPPG